MQKRREISGKSLNLWKHNKVRSYCVPKSLQARTSVFIWDKKVAKSVFLIRKVMIFSSTHTTVTYFQPNFPSLFNEWEIIQSRSVKTQRYDTKSRAIGSRSPLYSRGTPLMVREEEGWAGLRLDLQMVWPLWNQFNQSKSTYTLSNLQHGIKDGIFSRLISDQYRISHLTQHCSS